MRLDKNIWDPACGEYVAGAVNAQNVAHLTPVARAFVSLWLELLQDDRAPASRILRSLALPDLLAELRRAVDHVRNHNRSQYRLYAALRQLSRRVNSLAFDHPGRVELLRLENISTGYLELIESAQRQKAEKELRTAHSIDNAADVEKHLLTRIDECACACHVVLSTGTSYRDAITERLRSIILAPFIPFWRLLYSGKELVEELVVLAIDRGSSRESLAELPIKYLRADNHFPPNDDLDTRLRLILGAFRGTLQHYIVFLPLDGPELDIPGEVFPPGVTVLDQAAWVEIPQEFGAEGEFLESATQGLRVDTQLYVESFFGPAEPFPRDIFAARDTALRAARQCLDAVFLYRGRSPTPRGDCALEARDDTGIYRRVLESTRDHREHHAIELSFLRPVPADWSDALHWFRVGTGTTKPEAGIVNLWTAAETLAESGQRLAGHALDRVLRSVGTISTLTLFLEEHLYLGQAARAYATRFNRTAILQPPGDGADHKDILRWWITFSLSHDMEHLAQNVFDFFPHLAFEAERVKEWSLIGFDLYTNLRQAVLDNLCWIYGCRNDIVHEGRHLIPGAGIARRLLADYVGRTLRESLSVKARGAASNVYECFVLLCEMEITVKELLKKGCLIDALIYLA